MRNNGPIECKACWSLLVLARVSHVGKCSTPRDAIPDALHYPSNPLVPPMPHRNVFLIGMMASGKSTVGRHLANALKLDFVDSDSVIEKRAGADIPWIFDIEGEEKFRDREEAVIEELTRRRGVVLATGGGAVLREVNRRRLSERGTVVYLNAPFESLVARARTNTRRPLLAGEDAREKLAELMDQRGDLYARIADMEIHTDSRSPRLIAERIVAALEA